MSQQFDISNPKTYLKVENGYAISLNQYEKDSQGKNVRRYYHVFGQNGKVVTSCMDATEACAFACSLDPGPYDDEFMAELAKSDEEKAADKRKAQEEAAAEAKRKGDEEREARKDAKKKAAAEAAKKEAEEAKKEADKTGK